MSIPYNPRPTTKRFRVPHTLAADFDAFLNQDIPNTNMDFEILKNWYDKFEEDYEPQYVRGEIYPDSTKSRYENTDNNMNIRCSVSSGIRKGDMLIEPDGNIYILDWAVHLQSNNAPSRALRCNMTLEIKRFSNQESEYDEDGYLMYTPLEDGWKVIVPQIPCNAYRYDGRPEYVVVSGTPGATPNALTRLTVQLNEKTKDIHIGDRYKWGDEWYEIVDISRVGVDISGTFGTLMIQAKKAAGGIEYQE